jgi:hypothetical protein
LSKKKITGVLLFMAVYDKDLKATQQAKDRDRKDRGGR